MHWPNTTFPLIFGPWKLIVFYFTNIFFQRQQKASLHCKSEKEAASDMACMNILEYLRLFNADQVHNSL